MRGRDVKQIKHNYVYLQPYNQLSHTSQAYIFAVIKLNGAAMTCNGASAADGGASMEDGGAPANHRRAAVQNIAALCSDRSANPNCRGTPTTNSGAPAHCRGDPGIHRFTNLMKIIFI